MQFGNILNLVNGTEQVVFDYEVTGSAVSSIPTGNILNGDEDGWYTIIVRSVVGATNSWVKTLFNNDSGANYGYRTNRSYNTTLANDNGSAYTGGVLFGGYTGNAVGDVIFGVARLYAKSGAVRIVNELCLDKAAGTTATELDEYIWVWSNTADNLTSITFANGAVNGFGVGTRIIILKANNFTNGTPTGIITTPYIKGSLYRVSSTILGADGATISSGTLDGDRDAIYFGSVMLKNSAQADLNMKVNSDTGANYGEQYMAAYNTTMRSARYTGAANWTFNYNAPGANAYSLIEFILFAKSGYIRTGLTRAVTGIVGNSVPDIRAAGIIWNNTNTNITGLTLWPYTGNFLAGSSLEIYALRPNG